MQKGIKFRIYPNREQKNIINQTLGCCRLIYNKGLAMRNEAYQNGNKIGYSQTSAMLTDLKKSDDFAFLKAVDSIALQQSLRDLDRGFVNFFQKRALSRKQKGSNNRDKQRVKVALVHETITNQRNDFLQKQSTILIRENQTICIEDLKVKNMMRNHKLVQHIGSVSWSKFFDMLSYKSVWYGNDIVKVPTMYPSSQTCSCCGFKNPLVKNLAIRSWVCPECETKHDRDTNASINILNKGLQIQSA
jgi:putative transposase